MVGIKWWQPQYGQQNKGQNSQDIRYLGILAKEQGTQFIRDQPSTFLIHYISHEKVPNNDKDLFNMPILVIIIIS